MTHPGTFVEVCAETRTRTGGDDVELVRPGIPARSEPVDGFQDAAWMSLLCAILRTMTSHEQRAHWHQQATWLSQLGLSPDETPPVDAVDEVAQATLALLDEIRRLEDERDEARRIGTWLYHRSPGIRLYLGDTSEWPWLMENDE